jgi:hypothetical protein
MSAIITPRPSSFQLPDPRLTPVYRLEATLGEPADLGDTAAAELDWLNKGVFVSVGGRQPGGVVYETYLVQ